MRGTKCVPDPSNVLEIESPFLAAAKAIGCLYIIALLLFDNYELRQDDRAFEEAGSPAQLPRLAVG